MQWIAAINSLYNLIIFNIFKDIMLLVSLNHAIKIRHVFFLKSAPGFLIFLDCRLNNLVCLRKIIIKMDMLKSFGYASPSIYLLLRQLIDIISKLLMRDQHQMHLQISATITLFRKVLKHLGITYRRVCYICFKEFTELIINNINPSISFTLKALYSLFIKIHNIKAKEWIKNTSGCQCRIYFFKFFICLGTIILKFLDILFYRYINGILKLLIGFREFLLPLFNSINGSFVICLRHDV